jgi:hypothetical protein
MTLLGVILCRKHVGDVTLELLRLAAHLTGYKNAEVKTSKIFLKIHYIGVKIDELLFLCQTHWKPTEFSPFLNAKNR